MSIIIKFTLLYLLVTLAVLIAGGFIVFKSVQEEIDKEEARELKGWLDRTAERLKRGVSLSKLNQDPLEIKLLPATAADIPFRVYDTVAMHRQLQRPERHLKASASYRVNDAHYRISAYDVVVESDDIVDAITQSMTRIALLLLLIVAVAAFLISKKLLQPFHRTLREMRNFNLAKQTSLALQPTNTKEFEQLNIFLSSMTGKARSDYKSLKEFSENASHEMQTPLSIIRGKLELLMEAADEQERAKLIASAHDAIEKLSRMGQSLTLLTKLGNEEFQRQELIPLTKYVNDCIELFRDLVEMKGLQLTTEIDEQVSVRFNPVLLDLLLNNLLSNAIRHNIPQGKIKVTLRPQTLLVSNTGVRPEIPTELMFERFRKGNQSSESIGLGLAIVKQIVELSGAEISYRFDDGWHSLEVTFLK